MKSFRYFFTEAVKRIALNIKNYKQVPGFTENLGKRRFQVGSSAMIKKLDTKFKYVVPALIQYPAGTVCTILGHIIHETGYHPYVVKFPDNDRVYLIDSMYLQKPGPLKEPKPQHQRAVKGPCTCKHCGNIFTLDPPVGWVPPKIFGQFQRNHCPKCLYSIHIDDKYGDRKMWCGHKINENGPDYDDANFSSSLLVPISKTINHNGILCIVHECEKCKKDRICKVAPDDNKQILATLPMVDIETIR